MAVTVRTLRLEQALREQLEGVTNRQVRDLVAAWVAAWDEVAPDLNATLLEMLVAGERVSRAQLLRSRRLRGVLAVIRLSLAELAEDAGVRITGDLDLVIDRAGAAQASVIDSQLPPGFMRAEDLAAWSRLDARQIEAIVRRTTQQITALTRPLSAEAYEAVRRELIRGVAAGSNPRQTAARMVRRAEGRFNGGLTRALNIARTETLDAHRAAAALGQAQHADVLQGWSWLAQLDTRTCPSCWSQHGTVHPLTEPGPYDHQQGRCGRMSVTRPWADLGLDVPEPPSLLPDSETVFDGLPTEQQLEILGPARFDAWQRGEFPMDIWSARRANTGWRDSYGVAPAPSSSRGGRRAA